MRALNRFDGLRCSLRFTACGCRWQRWAEQAPAVPGGCGAAGHERHRGDRLPAAAGPQATVVILTVFEDDDKIFRAICAGAAGYLLKTSGTEDIAAAIRSAAAVGSPSIRIARRVLEMFSKAIRRRKTMGSRRELDILELLVRGKTIKEAAAEPGHWLLHSR